MVNVTNQLVEYHGAKNFDNDNTKDGATLKTTAHESVKASFMSNPYAIVNEDKTPDVSCIEDHVDIQESNDSAKLFSVKRHSGSNLEQVNEVNKNLAEMFCAIAEDRYSDANQELRRDYQGDAVRDDGHPSEDIIEESKSIPLLMEEEKSLKVKVADLEKKHHSSISCSHNSDNGCCHEVYYVEGRMVNKPIFFWRALFSTR